MKQLTLKILFIESVFIFTFSNVLYALDAGTLVSDLSNIAISTANGKIKDGKALDDAGKDAVLGSMVSKASTKLVESIIDSGIKSGLIKLSKHETKQLAERMIEDLTYKTLSKMKKVKYKMSPTAMADVAVGILIDTAADQTVSILNPTTTAEHLEAEYLAFGMKQARVAWAAKQGVHMAILEEAVIAGEQVSKAVELRQELKSLEEDNNKKEKLNSIDNELASLRTEYKRGTKEEKRIVIEKINNLYRDASQELHIDLKTTAKKTIQNIEEADQSKFKVLDRLAQQIKDNPKNADAYKEKAMNFVRDNFNDVDNKLMSTEGNYAKSIIDEAYHSVKKEDPNKVVLANLKSTDKKLKTNIKQLASEKENLKSKEARLERIRDEKRAAFNDVKNAEKGSDEYNYAKNRFFSLSSDYRALNNNIDELIKLINMNERSIQTLEINKQNLMSSIEDSIQDYNNDMQIQIANTSIIDSPIGVLWLGSITFNSEDKLAGGGTSLRYWGGQFNQSVAEALLYAGGSPVFNSENSFLIKNNIVTNFEIGHGHNTVTDNTKEFHIFNNEIDKTSSFYDQNLYTLKLERQLPNGNTLSIQTTGHYAYTAWGEWGQTGGLYTDINGATGIEQKATHNNWQVGQVTSDLPTQGSATYSGVVQGYYYTNSVGSSYGGTIRGTMSMSVDFANTSVVSGVLNLRKGTGATFATAHMDQMQINRSEGGFAGRLIGTDIDNGRTGGSQNMIVGQFNGPNAEEVSGIWNVTNTNGELADGVFAGKR